MNNQTPTHYELSAWVNGEHLLSQVITKEDYDTGFVHDFKAQNPNAVGYLLPLYDYTTVHN